MSRAVTESRYEKLTWPEINDTGDLRKVCILPSWRESDSPADVPTLASWRH